MMNVPTAIAIEGAALGSARATEFTSASLTARSEGIRRTQVLLRAMQLSNNDVCARIREEFGESRATLFRWRALVEGAPVEAWPALLLPKYKTAAAPACMPEQAWQFFLSDYHRPQQAAFDACYRRLVDTAKARGWGKVPSKSALRRRYAREVTPTTKLVRRSGVEAFEKSLPTQKRDKTQLEALQWVNADGHKFDVHVQWPMRDGSKPRITRPMLVAWQDIYSGKILAWRIDETENADAVRLAWADMLRDYGIPEHVLVDNGHAFASKSMTGGMLGRHRFKITHHEPEGVYKAFGAQAHFAIPYRGRSKPIERAFRDLCEDISKHPFCAGAYTGNAPHKKPEDYGTRAIPVEEFIGFVGRQIAAHNARLGRRSAVCAGRSFDNVFAESMAREGRFIRRATEAQLQWLLLEFKGVTIPRTGQAVLKVLGNSFFHESLLELRGQTVSVRFDPYDVHAGVYVFVEGNLAPHCHASCIEATGFGDTEAARRTERVRRGYVRAAKNEAAAYGTIPAHELTVAAPEATSKPKRSRVVAVDFSRAHKPQPTAAARKTMEDEADELLLALGRDARHRLNDEQGIARGK